MIIVTFQQNKQNQRDLNIDNVVGCLQSITERKIFKDDTSDISFTYYIMNVGGIEYDLSNCSEVMLNDGGTCYRLEMNKGNLIWDGNRIDYPSLQKIIAAHL